MSRYLHKPQGESDCSMEVVDAEGQATVCRSWSEKVISLNLPPPLPFGCRSWSEKVISLIITANSPPPFNSKPSTLNPIILQF